MRLLPLVVAFTLLFAEAARAFCGFYVARADSNLFNHASKVVLARQADRTVITMASDISGGAKEFALVIPVPTVVKREDVRLVASATIDHLDAYTAPRLVEYHDPDPCATEMIGALTRRGMAMAVPAPAAAARAAALGVQIEAQYSVGEYDIVVLSGTDSAGLLTWLNRNGYKVPEQAAPVVGSYLRQNMHFFLAKVNLERQQSSGSQYLRPIQVSYESRKFMLPIRLGTVNADGPQEMIAMTLSEHGRVETTNYRTVRLPTGSEVPLYIRQQFGPFYKAMFEHQVHEYDDNVVFLEYAWDMNWCDPCAANPMSADELRELGAAWVEPPLPPGPPADRPVLRRPPFGNRQFGFVTRLHVRYDRAHFPEDLVLQETADKENFQARYVLRHPFAGAADCVAGRTYRSELPKQFAQQARTLNELTGWPIATISDAMGNTGQPLR